MSQPLVLSLGCSVEWSPVLRRPWRVVAPDGSVIKRDSDKPYSYGFNSAEDAVAWALRNQRRIAAHIATTIKEKQMTPPNTEKESRPRPTLTRPQFKVLEAMTGGSAILGEKLNSALSYHYRIEQGDDVSDEMLTKLCTMHCIYGKVDEPGLSPRLRYTLTDRGRAQVEKNRDAFKGHRRGDRAA